MSVCIKDQIQNMNLVIGCTIGCPYCYARNNTRRYHMIDDFEKPEFFPGKLKMMERAKPQNFLLTVKTEPVWAYSLTEQAHELQIPVFWKEDLIPIMGEDSMIQEMPEAFNIVLEEQRKWNKRK